MQGEKEMASKRGIRRKSCTGKARHSSQSNAKRAVVILRKRGLIRGEVTVYHCKWCQSYHVGHSYYIRKRMSNGE